MSSKVAHEEKQRVRNTFRAEEHLDADELDKLDELTKEYHVQRKAIIAKARERWIRENKAKLESERIAKKVEKLKEECKYYETLLSVKEFEARKGE